MTFRNVVFKNFRHDLRRFLSLFISNSAMVMILFILLDLVFNSEFRVYLEKDRSLNAITSITVFVFLIFSIIFISYSQVYFYKNRSKDFSIFITLGMRKRDFYKLISLESLFVSITSLITGLLFGSVFTRLFFIFAMKISKFNKINHHYNRISYIITSLIFLSIFLVVLIISFIILERLELTELTKNSKKGDNIPVNSITFLLFGGLFLISSILLIILKVKEPFEKTLKDYLLLSIILCLVGLYIIIAELGSGLLRLYRNNTERYYSNILFINEIRCTFKRNKKIIFSCSILVAIILFGVGVFYSFSRASIEGIEEMYPYHVAYTEVLDINRLSKNEMLDITKSGTTKLLENKALEFSIAYTNITSYAHGKEEKVNIALTSEKNFNQCGFDSFINEDFHPKKGYGYLIPIENYRLPNIMPEDVIKVFNDRTSFNFKYTKISNPLYFITVPNCTLLLIVSEEDYEDVIKNASPNHMGRINMFRFHHWKDTEEVVDSLELALKNNNSNTVNHWGDSQESNGESYMFSTIKEFNTRKQNGVLSNFLAGFISSLFFIASSMMIYLKLYTEMEDERIKYNKLHRIGVKEEEFIKLIYKKLSLIFFSPLIFGGIPAYAYLFIMFNKLDFPREFYFNSSYLFIAYVIFQLLYYLIVRKRYVRNIISVVKQ
ncbi:ABC-type lipoprotein release transport system permease subunit [Clostridium punense]|uniref:ABC-type lipoprotein release transport system permease subunit n=1 Tax=Clostridium punense TaxID=1054297 RepID=A0ABS4K1I5_9CLOT|nr:MULTISPECIES: ABC transporter permease [Clostridium]EQB90305.1 hypothetical protein M918_00880 [Clostridium sp. BL8]MBP2021640.1 ABC-type lipoprotein release transport system permease subunit [Clostridium punense]